MAVTERTVKKQAQQRGELTGKAGTVYDVNVKYKSGGKSKTYSRKGFLTKKDALQHEAEMKAKLTNPAYTPPSAVQRKMTVREYMTEWIDRHGSANLRPSTEASYRSHMKNHIFPYIGDVFLNQLSPAMLDDMYRQLAEKGLSVLGQIRAPDHGVSGTRPPVSLHQQQPGQRYSDEVWETGQDTRSLHGRPDAAAAGRCHGERSGS